VGNKLKYFVVSKNMVLEGWCDKTPQHAKEYNPNHRIIDGRKL